MAKNPKKYFIITSCLILYKKKTYVGYVTSQASNLWRQPCLMRRIDISLHHSFVNSIFWGDRCMLLKFFGLMTQSRRILHSFSIEQQVRESLLGEYMSTQSQIPKFLEWTLGVKLENLLTYLEKRETKFRIHYCFEGINR